MTYDHTLGWTNGNGADVELPDDGGIGKVSVASRAGRVVSERGATPLFVGPIQRRATESSPLICHGPELQAHAAAGVAGAGGPLPHLDAIQRSFGAHDVGGVQAHVGGGAASASRAIGAEAYATGSHVAFAAEPSLFVAAHEAAHVVQQRAGVQLLGGVGQVGDPYEQHADAVAARVVAGQSAADLLGPVGHASPTAAVQCKEAGKDPPEQTVPLSNEISFAVKLKLGKVNVSIAVAIERHESAALNVVSGSSDQSGMVQNELKVIQPEMEVAANHWATQKIGTKLATEEVGVGVFPGLEIKYGLEGPGLSTDGHDIDLSLASVTIGLEGHITDFGKYLDSSHAAAWSKLGSSVDVKVTGTVEVPMTPELVEHAKSLVRATETMEQEANEYAKALREAYDAEKEAKAAAAAQKELVEAMARASAVARKRALADAYQASTRRVAIANEEALARRAALKTAKQRVTSSEEALRAAKTVFEEEAGQRGLRRKFGELIERMMQKRASKAAMKLLKVIGTIGEIYDVYSIAKTLWNAWGHWDTLGAHPLGTDEYHEGEEGDGPHGTGAGADPDQPDLGGTGPTGSGIAPHGNADDHGVDDKGGHGGGGDKTGRGGGAAGHQGGEGAEPPKSSDVDAGAVDEVKKVTLSLRDGLPGGGVLTGAQLRALDQLVPRDLTPDQVTAVQQQVAPTQDATQLLNRISNAIQQVEGKGGPSKGKHAGRRHGHGGGHGARHHGEKKDRYAKLEPVEVARWIALDDAGGVVFTPAFETWRDAQFGKLKERIGGAEYTLVDTDVDTTPHGEQVVVGIGLVFQKDGGDETQEQHFTYVVDAKKRRMTGEVTSEPLDGVEKFVKAPTTAGGAPTVETGGRIKFADHELIVVAGYFLGAGGNEGTYRIRFSFKIERVAHAHAKDRLIDDEGNEVLLRNDATFSKTLEVTPRA